MIPLIDFQDRSLNGQVKKADEFDLEFSMKIRELVEKYDIKYNPDDLIVDDRTADAVFNAGAELLAETGLYHLNTQRVINFSKDEILEFVNERKEAPSKISMGQGNDEMTIAFRTGKETIPPVLYAGAAGVITEEEFMPFMTSMMREKRIKGMGISGGIEKVNGIEPKAGTLSEIHCGLWEQEKLEKALEEVGRPGMSLGLLCTVSTIGATIQCLDRGFRGPHNTHIGVHIIPEQKIDWDRLMLSHFCEDRGIIPWQSAMSLIGGLCRDAADAAVSLVANVLGHMSYAHGPICSLFPTGLDGSWGTRSSIWAVSAASRASERNIRLAIGSGVIGSWQWGLTRIGIMQNAAQALVYTKSGLAYAWLGGYSAKEAVLVDDVMTAAAKMSIDEAGSLANAVIARIDELAEKDQPRGAIATFKDICDTKTARPLPEYERAFDQGREELVKLGIKL